MTSLPRLLKAFIQKGLRGLNHGLEFRSHSWISRVKVEWVHSPHILLGGELFEAMRKGVIMRMLLAHWVAWRTWLHPLLKEHVDVVVLGVPFVALIAIRSRFVGRVFARQHNTDLISAFGCLLLSATLCWVETTIPNVVCLTVFTVVLARSVSIVLKPPGRSNRHIPRTRRRGVEKNISGNENITLR